MISHFILIIVLTIRGLSQIIFPTVSVIMTLRGGGGGWESEGVTLTNQECFFFTRRGLAIARENVGRRPQVLQKALHPKHYAEVLATEGNSWRAAADEEEEEEQQQQEDTEDRGGESGDDKCMVCGEKEEDDVDIEDWVPCEMCSQWIHSKCIPSNHPYSISHADFHLQ